MDLFIITRLLDQPLKQEQESLSVDDNKDSFQVPIDHFKPLMSRSSADNKAVPSVKDILLLFAKWQASIWVDTKDTGILISQICLPSLSTDTEDQFDCEPVPMSPS